jgi:putative N6-adenine-specific DNA methylase
LTFIWKNLYKILGHLKKKLSWYQCLDDYSQSRSIEICRIKPSRKNQTFNAGLEARLVKYEMYEGSKRTKFQVKDSVE